MLKHKSRKTLEQSFELRPEPQTEASKILFNKNEIVNISKQIFVCSQRILLSVLKASKMFDVSSLNGVFFHHKETLRVCATYD